MAGKNTLLLSSFLLCYLSVLVGFPCIEGRITLPLSTESRHIVDRTERRVKLACVNWAAHLEPMVAEGLSNQPLDAISSRIARMGFNCVRLTWPLFLATNTTLASLTVHESFLNLGLRKAVHGLRVNNPSFLGLSLMDAFKAVVSSLGKFGLMVILDNHISQPRWCCSSQDDNGFFWDRYFNPNEWLGGLTKMATIFKDTGNVVGMSLRNELRGRKQNNRDWYRYMQQGAEAVHSVNPNVLIILSGLVHDADLSFLKDKPVSLTFKRKLVFEIHWYMSSDRSVWEDKNRKRACGTVKDNFSRRAGFLLRKGFPLFVGEFGLDVAGTNQNDNRYFNCFSSVAQRLDLDWALWTVVGSYYIRNGVAGFDEHYGLLTPDWNNVRNWSFLRRLNAIQGPNNLKL